MNTPFTFNHNGVCQNPEVVVVYHQSRRIYAVIRLARTPTGRWAVGHDYQVEGCSQMCGASLNHAPHKNREHALEYGLDCLLRVCNRFGHRAEYKAMRKGIESFKKATLIQSLF
ncbi:hypothetical protein [Spirosoma fluviale]|uniref:Uncharacterized protein n=1 Tax=Spirosoma fluviale TaxID=1597977 RepID=A0A286FC70_9BACT|nr:hypothetical protein [Spirosoma fluviale]SOD80825.1 hypothetical protein SAMN06269250_1579 [Spirosoma fluviale]